MDNLKDMSFTELIELQKKLNNEIEDRKIHKSDIYNGKIHGQFIRDWYKKGILWSERGSNLNALDSAIFKICDFTLENYKIIKTKAAGTGNQIQVNGKRIEIDNPDIYIEMTEDIFNVIIKYYEKSHKHKMKEMSDEEHQKILGEEEMDARC